MSALFVIIIADWQSTTTAIASIIGAVAAFLAALALPWLVLQTRAAKRAAMVEAWIAAETIFCNNELRAQRGILFSVEKPADALEWSAGRPPKANNVPIGVSYDEAKRICGMLNLCAAYAMRGGAMDKRYFLNNWADPFRKAWIVLSDVVFVEDTKLHRPCAWESFELAGRIGLTHLKWPNNWPKPRNWDAIPQFKRAKWGKRLPLDPRRRENWHTAANVANSVP